MIESVGFSPNRSARAMRGATEPVVGIIVSKFNSSGESQTLRAILTALYARQITPIIVESQFNAELVAHHLQIFQQRQIDSVIVFGFSPLSEESLLGWKGNMVVIARQFKQLSCVYYDDRNIGYLDTQQNLPLTYIGKNTLLQYFAPNLINLDFGYEQAGFQAVELLIRQIENDKTAQHQLVKIDTEKDSGDKI